MNKYWFKPRKFGWGFTPTSWEGWLTVLIMLGAIGLSLYANKLHIEPVSNENGFRSLLDIFLIVCIVTLISIPKTKGKIKWRWGNEKD